MENQILSSVIICSIVRNAEKGLIKNIPIIDELCKHFIDYKIIVYENDSIDGTKNLLLQWKNRNPEKIHISINNTDASKTIPKAIDVNGNPFFSVKRIEKMVHLRNHYMEYIEKYNWKADYIIVVDLDVAQLNLQGILSSFAAKNEWDAVTAFGYSTSPKFRRRYHDTYALTLWGDEDAPQTEEKIKRLADEFGNIDFTKKWIRVFSAFGGLAIYKYDAIYGLRYQLINNEDARVEVKCEHYSIYKQMKERGYDNVYINPSMILKYQNVTLNLILKRGLEKLKYFWKSFFSGYV